MFNYMNSGILWVLVLFVPRGSAEYVYISPAGSTTLCLAASGTEVGVKKCVTGNQLQRFDGIELGQRDTYTQGIHLRFNPVITPPCMTAMSDGTVVMAGYADKTQSCSLWKIQKFKAKTAAKTRLQANKVGTCLEYLGKDANPNVKMAVCNCGAAQRWGFHE